MSLTPIIFLLVFAAGLASAILLDASFGLYVYVINYFVNPQARWWADQIPELRYAFIIAAVAMASYLLRVNQYKENKIF